MSRCYFLVAGCSEKFNVAAPYKNITVVYAFLDQADTAHYIRIQKAFLDQSKSALTMSQSPDSSFYTNLNVRIERYNVNGTATTWTDTIHLNRVDLDLEGYPKQTTGPFFNAPNYAYKFKDVLDARYIYRLKVINLSTGQVDSSDAPIINDMDHSNASGFSVDALDDTNLNNKLLSFGNRLYTVNFAFNYEPVPGFNFEGLSTPASIAEIVLRFNWTDSNNASHTLTPRYYDYNLGYFNFNGNTSITTTVTNQTLLSAMATGLGPAPANTYRLIGRCTLSVYLSTQEYNNYYQNSLAQGTGLTGSEIEPV